MPKKVYRALSSSYHGILVIDLLLRVPRLATLLQSSSKSGNALARLITALQAPAAMAPVLHSSEASEGMMVGYGIDPLVFASAASVIFLAAVACCAVVTLQLDPAVTVKKDDGKLLENDLPSQLVAALAKVRSQQSYSTLFCDVYVCALPADMICHTGCLVMLFMFHVIVCALRPKNLTSLVTWSVLSHSCTSR